MVISKPCSLTDLPTTAWKNGGGTTRTLGVEPPGDALDDFLWRVSLAEVNSPGEFSLFPGVDRIILLWSGRGLILQASDWSCTLREPLLPFTFKGEDKIHCDLIGGPTTDLNVMVRRGLADAVVQVAAESMTFTSPVEVLLVLCARGNVSVSGGDRATALVDAGEFVWIENCDPGMSLIPSPGGATFLFISLSALTA